MFCCFVVVFFHSVSTVGDLKPGSSRATECAPNACAVSTRSAGQQVCFVFSDSKQQQTNPSRLQLNSAVSFAEIVFSMAEVLEECEHCTRHPWSQTTFAQLWAKYEYTPCPTHVQGSQPPASPGDGYLLANEFCLCRNNSQTTCVFLEELGEPG